jgi:hypothetical protein
VLLAVTSNRANGPTWKTLLAAVPQALKFAAVLGPVTSSIGKNTGPFLFPAIIFLSFAAVYWRGYFIQPVGRGFESHRPGDRA